MGQHTYEPRPTRAGKCTADAPSTPMTTSFLSAEWVVLELPSAANLLAVVYVQFSEFGHVIVVPILFCLFVPHVCANAPFSTFIAHSGVELFTFIWHSC